MENNFVRFGIKFGDGDNVYDVFDCVNCRIVDAH